MINQVPIQRVPNQLRPLPRRMDGGTARVSAVSRRAGIRLLRRECRVNGFVVEVKCWCRKQGARDVRGRLTLDVGGNQVAGVVGTPLWSSGVDVVGKGLGRAVAAVGVGEDADVGDGILGGPKCIRRL